MAKDVQIDTLTDDGLTRLWEGVMAQVAKDYIDLYVIYLKKGPDAHTKKGYGHKLIPVKTALIELEDYICGDLIAGPHADYIVKNLRKEAKNHVDSGKVKRKEIYRKW